MTPAKLKYLLGAVAATLAVAAVAAPGALAPPAATAASSPIALALPQGYAFAIIGHSCGGIQEKPYATGFAASTGYPLGDVYISTHCGGSGKGGGGPGTTYSAWVTVTWDFTGVVVSDGALASAPAVNQTLSVMDGDGNRLYNQPTAGVVDGSQVSAHAYLVLASGFVPAPRLLGLSAAQGPASGGTTVTISGTGFTNANAVSFGTVPAASYTINSDTSITAVSPVSPPGTVDVTVGSAGGASATGTADRFKFVGAPSITGLDPNQGSVTGGYYTTISGSNLADVTGINFGDTATYWTVNPDGTLSVYVPGGEQANDSTSVRVTSVGGTSSASFYYTPAPPPPPAPVVSGVDPSSGSVDGGDTVTISGSGFTGATGVSFGGVDAASFTIDGDGSITAVTPPGSVGPVDVTVTTPDGGQSAAVAADQFTYTDPTTTTTTTTAPPPPPTTTTTTTTAPPTTTATPVTPLPPPPVRHSVAPAKHHRGATHHKSRRHHRRRKSHRR